MWNRSAANKETGLMTVVCIDWNGNEFFRGEFADLAEANQAGADAERRMMNVMLAPAKENTLESILDGFMSDDDLLRELGA